MPKPERITDAFSQSPHISIEEGEGSVDGKSVLAKVKGEFFFPGGVSRNNRYYSKGLWERTISNDDIKTKLSERRMFGTISHDQKIDDEAVLEGRISHIVTKLEIVDGKGIGEALIINTPAGQIANTLFRAGCKMFVSSRADGEFEGTYNGVPKVSEDSYRLHTFDFVLDPGFLSASPALKESLNENFRKTFGKSLDEVLEAVKPALPGSVPRIEEPDESDEGKPPTRKRGDMAGEKDTTQTLLESMALDKIAGENKLSEALRVNSDQTGQIAILQRDNKTLSDDNKGLKTQIEASGDPATKLASINKTLEDLGSPGEIKDTYARINKHLERLKTLGKTQNMAEIYSMLEFAVAVKEEFGDMPELKTAFAMMRESISKWKELGSPKEVKEALVYANDMATTRIGSLINERAARIADETGIPVEIITPMLAQGQSEDQVRANLKKIGESHRVRSRYTAPPTNDNSRNPPADPAEQSRGMRLLESMGGTPRNADRR